jgi:lupus La protein
MTDANNQVNNQVQHDLDSTQAQKLKKQLEFYFSDSNFPRDRFLRSKAAENDGCIYLNPIPVPFFLVFLLLIY